MTTLATSSSVRFSNESVLAIVDCPGFNSAGRYQFHYSPEELHTFRTQALRDAQDISALIRGRQPGQAISNEAMCKSIGIENMISATRARHAAQQRQRHTRTILSNQGRCDADVLSNISRRSSGQASERAHMMASYYYRNVRV